MPDLSSEELRAIDFACMVLLETARRGRRMRDACIADGDGEAAEWYEQSLQNVDASRVTLRSLLARHKEVLHVDSANEDKVPGDVR